jgi:hypothetical protein
MEEIFDAPLEQVPKASEPNSFQPIQLLSRQLGQDFYYVLTLVVT